MCQQGTARRRVKSEGDLYPSHITEHCTAGGNGEERWRERGREGTDERREREREKRERMK